MLKKLIICVISFVLTGLASWLALWGANIINYVISLPISFLGIVLSESSGLIEFIYLAITTGIAYFIVFLFLFSNSIKISEDINDEHLWLGRIFIILLALCVILFCDPRIVVPIETINEIIALAKNEYNYYILGTVDWGNLDFSGDKIPLMQYTIFDIAVSIAGLCICLFGGLKD